MVICTGAKVKVSEATENQTETYSGLIAFSCCFLLKKSSLCESTACLKEEKHLSVHNFFSWPFI